MVHSSLHGGRRDAYPEAFTYESRPNQWMAVMRQDGRYFFARLGTGSWQSRQLSSHVEWRANPTDKGCKLSEVQARKIVARFPDRCVAIEAKAVLAAYKNGEMK